MTSRFETIVVDSHDPKLLADFWCAVLGYQVVESNPDDDDIEIASAPLTVEAVRAGPIAPSILFQTVPEGKSVKNRLHLDVTPIDSTQDLEVERLLALGARHIDIGQGEQNWVVLGDPEGNEFCVLRSLAPDA